MGKTDTCCHFEPKAKNLKRSFTAFRMTFLLGLVVLAFHPLHTGVANIRSSFSPEKSTLEIKFKNEASSYRVTSMFLLPGESTQLSLSDTIAISTPVLSGATEGWTQTGLTQWTITAPKKSGLYPVRITHADSTDSILVNVFVMIPLSQVKNGMLNGYKIGTYPKVPADKAAMYPLPRGFVEVTPENRNTFISPHFRLGQFLCKQEGKYPKYVVLRERLPLKLETVMETLNQQGIVCHSLSIMSGYRTPHYNHFLGNVKYSRHMWGDAADIFIDSEPAENTMADLNGDGKRDFRDGELIYNALNELDEKPSFAYAGGLAKYKPTRSHGPFIHVDARGTSKRWGE